MGTNLAPRQRSSQEEQKSHVGGAAADSGDEGRVAT